MIFRTRSILQLTILGFLLVASLLIAALLMSARELDVLTVRSQATIANTASAMRNSRLLVEHVAALERSARQFLVVRDPALMDVYDTRRAEMQNVIESLYALEPDAELHATLSSLQIAEAQANDALNSATSQSRYEYPQLLELAQTASNELSAWVESQVRTLLENTEQSQQDLNLRTLLLVLTALVLAMLFVALITRPLSRLNSAIRALGAGKYEHTVRVGGPADLRRLGEQLDWLRERLYELERQRNTFLRHVSHELKTPLAAIQESTSLLQDNIAGAVTPEQQTLLSIQRNNAIKLQHLIEGLLKHHAASFSVVEAAPVNIRLNNLIKEVLGSHQDALNQANLQAIVEGPRTAVKSDRERIRVIMDNLISNAVKFSADGGQILISLQRSPDQIQIDIKDSGPGVPQTERDHIFSAFYKGSNKPRKHYQSTGLGLAIAREYAESVGGSLTLEPTDQGALFRLTLPRQRAKE